MKLAPPGHKDRPGALNNLGIAWQERCHRTLSLPDLEQAVAITREAVALSPDQGAHDPARAGRPANLAHLLKWRFEAVGRPADIDEAIGLVDEALRIVPRHHPKRAELLPQLVTHLQERFDTYRGLEDMRRILDLERLMEADGLVPEHGRGR
ncbi:hypothetical protein GCM10010329_44060 [Streptomyces spiroverticillatus]|uniref:Tetratricopeptide repeat protein n=1 Tax=Streptomyces finlayi TaxID=67296 RepID=A0A918WZI6_9ACTN|nr:hypothetical protein [Streptomyces finlayi]GHA16373.1 hypothetical protein GCM10010329_44060 [Streptomyces spiroverticillatus]GHC98637.1 hypothetical protein GCM10010334_41240 [Streptomyces finlayi]